MNKHRNKQRIKYIKEAVKLRKECKGDEIRPCDISILARSFTLNG